MPVVTFERNRKNDDVVCFVVTGTYSSSQFGKRFNKKPAFVSKSYEGQLPKVGETWEVEVVGENKQQTVYYIVPVRKIDRDYEAKISYWANEALNCFSTYHPGCQEGVDHCRKVAKKWVDENLFQEHISGIIREITNIEAFKKEVSVIAHQSGWTGNKPLY